MKILVYPFSGNNLYHQLLYNEQFLKKYNIKLTYITGNRHTMALFPFVLFKKRLQGYEIMHLNWPNFYVSNTYPNAKFISYLLSFYCIFSIRLMRFHLVWTIHNVLPHETQTSNDLTISRYLAKIANAKIIHSNYTLGQMRELKLDTNNTFVIPHGNYIGAYPDNMSRSESRRVLKIRRHEFVILFFGLIRPYKGLDDLLKLFRNINHTNTRLIVAGKCLDANLKGRLEEANQESMIDFYDGEVADKDVAMYFKACDVVCLPFKTITNSASALLALSFGKPIIAPRLGALKDLPQNVGFLYDPNKVNALGNSLELAVDEQEELNKLGNNAKRYAESLSWNDISGKTYKVYRGVLREVANKRN